MKKRFFGLNNCERGDIDEGDRSRRDQLHLRSLVIQGSGPARLLRTSGMIILARVFFLFVFSVMNRTPTCGPLTQTNSHRRNAIPVADRTKKKSSVLGASVEFYL
jgi:hypothetical protein